MKLIFASTFAFCCSALFLQCASNSSKEISILEKSKHTFRSLFKDSATTDKQFSAYVVLPNTGCMGCISSTEQMLNDFVNKKYPVRFILTNILSYKSLRQKLGDSIIYNSNVYIDQSNETYRSLDHLQQIYPAIFYNNEAGEFSRFEYVDPDNPEAIMKLYGYITGNKGK